MMTKAAGFEFPYDACNQRFITQYPALESLRYSSQFYSLAILFGKSGRTSYTGNGVAKTQGGRGIFIGNEVMELTLLLG